MFADVPKIALCGIRKIIFFIGLIQNSVSFA